MSLLVSQIKSIRRKGEKRRILFIENKSSKKVKRRKVKITNNKKKKENEKKAGHCKETEEVKTHAKAMRIFYAHKFQACLKHALL